MKKFYLFIVLVCLIQFGQAQFVAMPLNYTNDNTFHTPDVVSIVDENTVWVATRRDNPTTFLAMPYSVAIKTSDGGNSWQELPLPVTGSPFMMDVEAGDENNCYYMVADLNTGGGSVWKTTDGGINWANKTTTEFAGSFGDFIHLFGQDTLIALGDPAGGYYDIQISTNGGNTWTRVPQANIPSIITGEAALGGKSFACIGNTIWFGSSLGRCFKSVDKGLHWTVSNVQAGTFGLWTVCFTDLQNGVFYEKGRLQTSYYKTIDGGETWTLFNPLPALWAPGISRIEGMAGAYILSAADTADFNHSYIYFTSDNFESLSPIDTVTRSMNYIYFKDAATGWLSGRYHNDSNIYKYTGVLTAIHEKLNTPEQLSVIPNPSSADAVVSFPSAFLSQRKTLRIYDLTGRLTEERVCEPDVQSIRLNASNYSNGVYMISVVSGNGVVSNCRWVVAH